MVQLFLLVTLVSKASYLALISLLTAMILVPYLFSAIYGLAITRRGEGEPAAQRPADLPVAALATAYCLWLLYAAGLKYLLLSALLYAPGAVVYLWAKKERAERPFTTQESVVLALLALLAAVAAYMLGTHQLSL